MRTTALVTKLLSFCCSFQPLVSCFSADPIRAAQGADASLVVFYSRYKCFPLFHHSFCLPRHLTHFLVLRMPFILTKTVTYVSSLPVTYLTSLYTLAVRLFCRVRYRGRAMLAPTILSDSFAYLFSRQFSFGCQPGSGKRCMAPKTLERISG